MSSNATAKAYTFKVVLLGEGCVGKTSLVIRYVEDKFNDKHVSTLQASFLSKKLNLNGTRANLAIWDTAGQERFHALGPIYYREANGAVLVYDITDEDSFTRVKNWVKELRTMLGNSVCLCIAGNKIDLERGRVVPIEEAEKYAKSVGAKHYSTSAKLNRGIQDVFLELTQRMIESAKEKEERGERPGSLLGQGGRNSVQVLSSDEEAAAIAEKSGCCG
ncbi:unnamed protein product [Notodromas monacha]|uniref:Ras-related protein Rab-21 n=1 Tax=Notodromas monacha TaxID=399045 RepID=A0A7R9BN27_9CRUS|nr:unnamed protein product [Notodromas monacha]CAG0918540.1 unnamed protein product [Notodromas monacha]